jgi:hypothetical protein
MLRIIINILILFLVFLSPSYITAILIFISFFIFNNFFEGICFGLILDILYGGNMVFGLKFNLFFFLLFIIIYFISPKIKKMLKFY